MGKKTNRPAASGIAKSRSAGQSSGETERRRERERVEEEVMPDGTILYTEDHPEGIRLSEVIAAGQAELVLPPAGEVLLYNLEFPNGILEREYLRLKVEQREE